MNTVCVPARFGVMALVVMIALSVSVAEYAAHDPATGTKPELQAKQTVDTQTRPISGFKIIREAGGRYEEITDIIIEELGLTCGDMSEQNDTTDQIVIGDMSNQTIATLASSFCLNDVDLGEEGYNFVSRPNPESSNGSWIILIFGEEGSSKGVFRGAYTLLDLLADNGNNEIGNYRIRDYPDRPFRGLMHWIGYIFCNGAGWVDLRKTAIKQIAGTGCNALHLGKSEFWRMDSVNVYDLELFGRWMNEVAYWARYYGMEPIPEVWGPTNIIGSKYPLWREGEYIKDEPFNVVYDGNEYVLEPAITPFDNDAYNMDFERGGGWPEEWTCTWNCQAWSHLDGDDDWYMQYKGNVATYLEQVWNASAFQPGSYYVLECIFSDVDTDTLSNASPWLAVSVKNSSGDWDNIFHGRIVDRSGIFTKDFFFWTPPDSAHAPEGYPGNWDPDDFHPYYDDIEQIMISIYCLAGDGELKFNVHSLFLERRAGALRNVMLDPGNELDLTITDEGGSPYSEGGDYEIISPEHDLDWMMPTHKYDNGDLVDNVTTIEWVDTLDVPSQVWVSYTAGVPADWASGGQKTTFCLKNEEFLDFIGSVLEDFYEPYDVDVGGLTEYTLNPKYIDIRMDEIRGTNRCGRCADFDSSGEVQDNDYHLTDYIKTFQSMLDDLAQQYEAAAETKLIVSANMLGRFRNGGDPGYQFQYGGPWGGIPEGHLAELDVVNNDIIFTMTHVNRANEARNAGWPGVDCAPGQENLFVVAAMQSSTSSERDSAWDFAPNATWYEDDALGFTSIGYDEIHTEHEELLLDFAWKRYRNPDATLQAHRNCNFLTDDVGGRTVEIDENQSVTFWPFGHIEKRDPETDDYTITYAKISWGEGPPTYVDSILNQGVISHTFEGEGLHDVTLTIAAEPAGGGIPDVYSAVIPVDVADTDPDPPPGGKEDPTQESSLDLPDSYALYQNIPNPFNPGTEIRFDLPEPAAVKLAIYNIKGELVRTLIDNQLAAGRKVVDWDGKNNLGIDVASGIYFYRIKTKAFVESRKMILIR